MWDGSIPSPAPIHESPYWGTYQPKTTDTMPTNLQMNRFYQMQDAMSGGYLPDTQFICTTKKQAKELARDQVAHNYRGDDNLKVLGNAEDGYEIVRKGGPFGEELHRVVNISGPMSAEEMGFDSLAHLIRHQEWGWMKDATKILNEED